MLRGKIGKSLSRRIVWWFIFLVINFLECINYYFYWIIKANYLLYLFIRYFSKLEETRQSANYSPCSETFFSPFLGSAKNSETLLLGNLHYWLTKFYQKATISSNHEAKYDILVRILLFHVLIVSCYLFTFMDSKWF